MYKENCKGLIFDGVNGILEGKVIIIIIIFIWKLIVFVEVCYIIKFVVGNFVLIIILVFLLVFCINCLIY